MIKPPRNCRPASKATLPGLPSAQKRPRRSPQAPAAEGFMYHPQIVMLATSSLKPNPSNARTHKESQLFQLEAVISKYGWLVPLVVDADLMILAGHARYEIAKRMGLETVPCIMAEHLSPTDRACVCAR